MTFFISVLKQHPEQHHAKKRRSGADKSKAFANVLSDRILDIVRQLYTATNTGKRLSVHSSCGSGPKHELTGMARLTCVCFNAP